MLKALFDAVDTRRKKRKLNAQITRVLSIPLKVERKVDKNSRKVWRNAIKTIRA